MTLRAALLHLGFRSSCDDLISEMELTPETEMRQNHRPPNEVSRRDGETQLHRKSCKLNQPPFLPLSPSLSRLLLSSLASLKLSWLLF